MRGVATAKARWFTCQAQPLRAHWGPQTLRCNSGHCDRQSTGGWKCFWRCFCHRQHDADVVRRISALRHPCSCCCGGCRSAGRCVASARRGQARRAVSQRSTWHPGEEGLQARHRPFVSASTGGRVPVERPGVWRQRCTANQTGNISSGSESSCATRVTISPSPHHHFPPRSRPHPCCRCRAPRRPRQETPWRHGGALDQNFSKWNLQPRNATAR